MQWSTCSVALAERTAAGPRWHVKWSDWTIPGAFCGANGPVQLRNGLAWAWAKLGVGETWDRGMHPHDALFGLSSVQYGVLGGRDVAALNVGCNNGGETSDGDLGDAWFVYIRTKQGPKLLATLMPQQPLGSPSTHVPMFSAPLVIRGSQVTAQQVWWGPDDFPPVPSIRATTKWSLEHGTLVVVETTVHEGRKGR